MKLYNSLFYFLLMLGLGLVVSCSDDDDPEPEENEEEEVISEVVLTFTPDDGGDAVVATWFDADGDGPNDPTIDEIELIEDETYILTITLANTLGTEVEDITAEIDEEADEHMFFFSFTEGIFEDPEGDGNVDNRADPINYEDEDGNGFPVGLTTEWTAGEHGEGEFTVVLKHQPDGLKTETSGTADGGTDVNITFPLHVEEGDHDHDDEEEEVINEVVLTFTPDGGDPITATWFDADGDGVGSPEIEDIVLAANTEYTMTITLANTLEDEDVTEEIEEEAAEHMFFFAFTADIFSSPAGDGNFDGREDEINYLDEDENGEPVGLETSWTTGGANSGTFQVVLKHQPDEKTDTSDATVGGTDVNIEFPITIE